MKTQKTNNTKSKQINNTILKTLTIISLSTLLITGCSSTCKKQNLTIETLNKQNELISKIRDERTQEDLKQKLSKDSDIKAAERHLIEAIEALQKSNEIIKEAVSQN